MVRHRPQREDIQLRGISRSPGNRLRRHIEQTLLIAEEIEVQTPSGSWTGAACGCTVSSCTLPIEDLDLQCGPRGVCYQNRLWAEGLMIEAVLVGVSEGFGDLPYQRQAHADIEMSAGL